MATSFSGGGSRSTRREPSTMDKQLVDIITCAVSRVHPFCKYIMYLCIMFKIIEFLIMCAGLYVRAGILLTCEKHFHECIISLRGEVWVHNTCFPHHFLLKCLYKAREVSGGVSVCFDFYDFLLDFGTVSTMLLFFCFGTVSTMLLFFVLELYRQCFCFLFWNCIGNAFVFLFWNCIDNAFVFCFGTVSTMLLFFALELYRQCFYLLFWNCIDNAFVFCFGTVSTMLLFFVLELSTMLLFFVLELYRQCFSFFVLELYRQCFCFLFWNCIDNAFVFVLELYRQCFCLLF